MSLPIRAALLAHVRPDTGTERRIDDFTRITTEGGAVPPPEGGWEGAHIDLTYRTKRFLRLGIETTFWCTDAEYDEARKVAEDSLMYNLYGAIMPYLHMARSAIMNGDKLAALNVVDEMQRAVLGESK